MRECGSATCTLTGNGVAEIKLRYLRWEVLQRGVLESTAFLYDQYFTVIAVHRAFVSGCAGPSIAVLCKVGCSSSQVRRSAPS